MKRRKAGKSELRRYLRALTLLWSALIGAYVIANVGLKPINWLSVAVVWALPVTVMLLSGRFFQKRGDPAWIEKYHNSNRPFKSDGTWKQEFKPYLYAALLVVPMAIMAALRD